MDSHSLQFSITFFGDSYEAEISIASQLLIRKILPKSFLKKFAPLWNYDVILKGCAPFFNWCIYVVIVTGFVMFIVVNVFHIWLVLVYFRNYIFILMTSALSILPSWRHNDVTYFKIQDFTKGMNVMRLENLFYCK